MTPEEFAVLEGRAPRPEWLQERDRSERERDQTTKRVTAWLCARGWIKFGDIAEWCARESGRIEPKEAARARAYDELWKAVCAGEFDESGRTRVALLNPKYHHQRLDRKLAKEALDEVGMETFARTDLTHYWAPLRLCHRWFERRNLPLPPHLFPPDKSATTSEVALRPASDATTPPLAAPALTREEQREGVPVPNLEGEGGAGWGRIKECIAFLRDDPKGRRVAKRNVLREAAKGKITGLVDREFDVAYSTVYQHRRGRPKNSAI